MKCLLYLVGGVLLWACLWHTTEAAKHLPKYITKCKRRDPDLGGCIKAQVEKLRPRLLKGIPELHIPPYDPMEIPELYLEQGTDAVKFKANFHNVRTYGARHTIINGIKVNLTEPRIDIGLHFPNMRIKTQYTISGKILVLPVQGSGSSDGNFTDVKANVTLLGKYETRNGENYITLAGKKVSMSIGGSYMYFDNFFNGNKELIETTNNLINQNWKDIVEELKPVLEDTIASVVFQLVRHVFDNYSLDELLPL